MWIHDDEMASHLADRGGVDGASLPEGQQFDTKAACEAAAETIKELAGVLDAGCIEIPARPREK